MGLARYTARRLLQAIPVLIGIVTITFLLSNAIPGNPARIMLGPAPTPGQVAAVEAKFGLDQPLYVRYLNYLVGVAQGDLGQSLYYQVPVVQKILERLPVTMLLLFSSFVFAIAVSIPLGVVSAQRRNKPTDHVARVVALIGVSTPSFWIGLMLIIIFAFKLGWLPATNLILPWTHPLRVEGATTRLDVLVESGRHLLLPMLSLGTLQMAALTRIERSSMLETLSEEYVKLARAYGVSETTILRKHAFRNAQLPVLTVLGLNLSTALGGAVLTETVFSINGMGTLILTAVLNQDYQLLMGTTLVFGLAFVVGVILTDLSYAYVDPRVSYGENE
ncbi:ABC transporter permease [Halococcus sp. IIIV-5B]|uniref:ABC transporter permease n=1 Tax=Halococcus sp. IIIV-5B TaxID=2321230 RepID=UPI000E75E534|nr:ABC transporter permease [Halococcus sp. IIIV-5B]RJT06160.1 ABC transporter permease [Halococcus sp. IIIV-5B]